MMLIYILSVYSQLNKCHLRKTTLNACLFLKFFSVLLNSDLLTARFKI